MKRIIAIVVVALVSAAWLLFPLLPPTEKQKQKSVADVMCRYCYALDINGKSSLFIRSLEPDWSTTPFSSVSDTLVCDTIHTKGRWVNRWEAFPSCHGRIRIPNIYEDLILQIPTDKDSIRQIVDQQIHAFSNRLRQLTHAQAELDYYLLVHNVTDEGYNTIASYAVDVISMKKDVARALAVLERITEKDVLSISLIRHFSVALPSDSAGTHRSTDCLLTDKRRGNDFIIQTADKRSPKGIYANYFNKPDSQQQAKPHKRIPYQGEMREGKREGHGIYNDDKGNYYDGFWKDDKREGFGFAIDTIGRLRAGEWKADVFQGERMTYTADHVYGIDISRYQHDIGKKKYAINWAKVRISHLGTISNKKIHGNVDYPVSFCYLKSTEGKTIKNNYFVSDYVNAKKVGIRCGAYHFFSTKSTATEQARWFLKNTRFQKGDLPPVLDIEPSGSQIRAMGGSEAMWKEIRTWLTTVEKTVGVKPLLYVSQNFVNKYMQDAPDIKRNYRVWIARYGEYKPDIKLVIWQLCPDGQVTGIKGKVDINVFNGYNDQYEDFLEENCIK